MAEDALPGLNRPSQLFLSDEEDILGDCFLDWLMEDFHEPYFAETCADVEQRLKIHRKRDAESLVVGLENDPCFLKVKTRLHTAESHNVAF